MNLGWKRRRDEKTDKAQAQDKNKNIHSFTSFISIALCVCLSKINLMNISKFTFRFHCAAAKAYYTNFVILPPYHKIDFQIKTHTHTHCNKMEFLVCCTISLSFGKHTRARVYVCVCVFVSNLLLFHPLSLSLCRRPTLCVCVSVIVCLTSIYSNENPLSSAHFVFEMS